MSSNIELLKKNGELIEKYYSKLTNEVRRLTDEPVDDTAIERCNSEMLSILNEFAFERDKLYGTDLDQVTAPFDNEEPFTHLATDEILEKTCSSQKQKLYRLHTNQTSYLIKDEDYEGFKSGKSDKIRISLFNDENGFFIGEQHFIAQFDDWGPYIVINDVRYRPAEFLLVEDEELKEIHSSHNKKAYDTMMSSRPKDHSKSEKQHLVQNTELSEDKKQEFNRSESLTFDETDKEEKWCKEHNDRYHRKNDEKKFKENPFHGGVSPVGRFVTIWQYCSISSWCECVCKDCYKKYRKAKKKLEKMSTCVQSYDADCKKQKEKVDELYKRAVFTVRDIDE